jgi:hypothetical protein
MARARDLVTLDLFGAIPVPAPQGPGSMHYHAEIAHTMSAALKEALLAELGEIGRVKQELAEQEKAIKAALGRGGLK